MSKSDDDQSVFNEPFMRGDDFESDPSEPAAARRIARDEQAGREEEQVDGSVFDDPTFSPELAGVTARPEQTYADFIRRRRAKLGIAGSWALSLIMSAAAGPFAVAGTFMTGGQAGTWGLLSAVVAAPLVEEMMKIALPLWAVERKPWIFVSRVQIAMTAIASGLVFASIENLLYLHVYIPDPPPGLIAWRWTVCMALHSGCALISSLGLMKVWANVWRTGKRASIGAAGGHIIAAMTIHGLYNLVAMLAEFSGYHF
ncbi:MAG: PrsW family intramembrane metalloprotease [Planctomycetes bacterium]|nr:PrsW family intramembrane metalloprotease [Planctomycetota bacterium]